MIFIDFSRALLISIDFQYVPRTSVGFMRFRGFQVLGVGRPVAACGSVLAMDRVPYQECLFGFSDDPGLDDLMLGLWIY